MFYVGQKVVCIDNSGDSRPHLVLNAVYTIESMNYRLVDWEGNKELGVNLVEVPHIETEDYYAEYRATRFRPLEENKTDISVFKSLLNPIKEEELV